MEAAKNAVKSHLGNHGNHTTAYHETTNPHVVNETVNQHRHEKDTTAIDKEVHQHHYHTSVQPIHDSKTLEEKHHHNVAPVEHRVHHHGNDADVDARLKEERAKFQNTSVEGTTTHSHEANPVVAGEHKHHHVHESIQPVVQRQTVQPHVVHNTIPIHETHHNAAQHHATTSLPAVTMEEFKKNGGALGGQKEHSDFFKGEPGNLGSKLHNDGFHGTHGAHQTGSSTTTGTSHTNGHTTGLNNTSTTGTHHTGSTHDHTTGVTGTTGHTHAKDATTGHGHTGTTHDTTTTTHKKPSLIDRLNPLKDADGDGKKGIMD